MPEQSAPHDPSSETLSLKSRLAEELRRYALVSLYLFICFGTIVLYEASQSPTKDPNLLSFGAALIKALVIGKFLLIGEAMRPGSRIDTPSFVRRIAWRTLGMLIVLVILKLIEELVIGLVHGAAVSEIADELLSEHWIAIMGPLLLMLLILIPLMAAIELRRILGPDGMQGLWQGSGDQR